MEGKIHFVFKIYRKFTFNKESIWTCFNESKIVISIQKGGENSILQKLSIARTEKLDF